MFRPTQNSLQEDYQFPCFKAELETLGFVINSDDQIRSITDPLKTFDYRHTNNELVNDVRREALHECIRNEITNRMIRHGIPPLYLPHLSPLKPASGKSVPIYATPLDDLKSKKRIIVIINHEDQDLGVWAYRIIKGEGGVDAGSASGFVKTIRHRLLRTGDMPGIIILNPGQLRFSREQKRVMTRATWATLPRESRLHPPVPFDELDTVPGHRTPREHIKTVFDELIDNYADANAEIYAIAIDTGATNLIQLMLEAGSNITNNITALACVGAPTIKGTVPSDLLRLLQTRCRNWTISEKPTNTLLGGPNIDAPEGR